MDFAQSIKTCLTKKYVDIKGRASRSEFWWFWLFCVIVFVIVNNIHGILSLIVHLALLLPSLTVAVRRLHDVDRSGWWLLIGLIPIIGFLVLLYFYVIEGTKGPNQYGDVPA